MSFGKISNFMSIYVNRPGVVGANAFYDSKAFSTLIGAIVRCGSITKTDREFYSIKPMDSTMLSYPNVKVSLHFILQLIILAATISLALSIFYFVRPA